ncbi:nucleoside 2-deoxyribosyltransferase [Nocardia fusca]|uniref:nucleoside 2-deoxyribosyltransferase n=1 Tax=Nocardia fusca TaxID=941183 RepID=UPI0037CA77CB
MTRETCWGRVYLAGPFTSALAQPTGAVHGKEADTITPTIPAASPWRRSLQRAEDVLLSMGWQVFLPHRDVSEWGARDVPSEVVVRECLDAVLDCDLVIALLGESFGTHVEVGAALGHGIPVIVVTSADARESYFATGIGPSHFAASLQIETVEELPGVLTGPDFAATVAEARSRAASGTGSLVRS